MVLTLLSLLSGVLTGLSFNFQLTSFLIWFSLIPFIQVINKSSFKLGILRAGLFGLAYYLTAIFWVGKVTLLGLIVLVIYLSLYYVLFFILGRYFLKRPFRIISLPCLWVFIEFLKENIWTGFGWANLGYSQYTNLYLIQVADIWGTKLISFLIVMFNVFIWEIISLSKFRLTKVLIKQSLFVIFVFSSVFSYSLYRFNSLEETDSLEVSIVQPNIAQSLKWDPAVAPAILEKLESLTETTKDDTLVILPEAAWPYIVDKQSKGEVKNFVNKINRELVIGSVTRKGDKFYNSALFFQDREAGLIWVNTYHKMKLVPFGEYVPLRNLLSFVDVLNLIGDITPGEVPAKFIRAGHKYSVFICFEDIFPAYISKLTANSDFLVNITNDAWFGGEPQASQHLSVMTLRAIENRISIVRSANTGISGWVSFRGEIEKLKNQGKALFSSGAKTFRISLNDKRSFYATWGDFFPILCGMFLLVVFMKANFDQEEK